MKLETFLRMSKINYDIQFLATPLSAPNGKVPYVRMDGQTISDSSVIIRQLSKDKDISHLTKDDSGVATPISRLLEDHLYWVMVYSRFVDPSGIPNWKDEFRKLPSFKTKPSFLYNIIFKVLQKKVTKELFQVGLGRLKQDDIYAAGIEDIRSLSLVLGSKPYFCGAQVSLIDASVYAQIASLIYIPWQCPLKDLLLNNYTNLVDHTKRMGNTYFPELKPVIIN